MNTKKEMLERVNLILLENDVDEFIYNYAKDILIYDKPIEDLIKEADNKDLNLQNLNPYIIKLHEIFDHIETLIHDTSESYFIPNIFEEFLKDKDIKIDDYKEWYKIVYEIILSLPPKQPPSNSMLGAAFNFNTASFSTTIPYRMRFPVNMSNRIKERNQLKDEIKILSGFKEEQEAILKDYGKISGLWGGLIVLAYSTLASIIIPVLLLPYPLDKYDDLATRNLLISLFFTTLTALFIYLGISMYKLTKKD